RRRHTSWPRDWSSDVCSSDLLVHGQRRLQLSLLGVGDPWGRGKMSRRDERARVIAWSAAAHGAAALTALAVFTALADACAARAADRKSVVEGKSGDLGGCRFV